MVAVRWLASWSELSRRPGTAASARRSPVPFPRLPNRPEGRTIVGSPRPARGTAGGGSPGFCRVARPYAGTFAWAFNREFNEAFMSQLAVDVP